MVLNNSTSIAGFESQGLLLAPVRSIVFDCAARFQILTALLLIRRHGGGAAGCQRASHRATAMTAVRFDLVKPTPWPRWRAPPIPLPGRLSVPAACFTKLTPSHRPGVTRQSRSGHLGGFPPSLGTAHSAHSACLRMASSAKGAPSRGTASQRSSSCSRGTGPSRAWHQQHGSQTRSSP